MNNNYTTHQEIFDEIIATHGVSGILDGAEVYFIFD
jgi:hypothetical protein